MSEKYPNLPTLGLIALVCICASVLAYVKVLPSEAATAILGGAVVQAVALARQGGGGGGGNPPAGGLAAGGGTAVAMLLGALAPYAIV